MKTLTKTWFNKWTGNWNLTIKIKSPQAQLVESVARAVQITLTDPSFPYPKEEEGESNQPRAIGFQKEEE